MIRCSILSASWPSLRVTDVSAQLTTLEFVRQSHSENLLEFELLLAVIEMSRLPRASQQKVVVTIADRHLGSAREAIDASQLPQALQMRAGLAIATLATNCLPGFLRSSLSDGTVRTVHLDTGTASLSSSASLLWDEYEVPTDAAAWLFSIVSAVEKMDVSVSISDMRVAGNPLVYVNQAFCRMTGYSKSEILGRNCRFLQGPETEVESVSALVDALRHGADVTVKLTNYRRSGETFGNLVSLRPVHDSNGVYRFVIAVNADMSGLTAAFELHAALVQLLPRRIKLTQTAVPCGP